MKDDIKFNFGNVVYFRKKGNWFKELLIKLRIIKPKYIELGPIKDIDEIENHIHRID